MQGILLIDKPKTWTSFDVVNYVRKLVRQANSNQSSVVGNQLEQTTENRPQQTKPPKVRVGHTGTLDPLATGLLVILVGKEYTRRATELSKHDKTYEVTMKLGEVSTTGDDEGEKTPYRQPQPTLRHSEQSEESVPGEGRSFARAQDDGIPTQNDIERALQAFTGQVMQTPPIYSAMKVNGQRAYKLARAGKAVELEARPAVIYENRLTSYEYPYVCFTSHVGSGTYIRSLVEDLGKLLGTGAYMSDLRRTTVGEFTIQDARQIDDKNLLDYLEEV